MRRILPTLFAVCLSWVTVTAQPEITVMKPWLPADGTIYFLPKTVLQYHVTIEKQTYTPGIFARYASHYLHLQGVDLEAKVSHRVAGINVSLIGIRDSSKWYKVKLKGKSKLTEINLSDDGVLLSVNASPLPVTPPNLLPPLTAKRPKANVDPYSLLSREALKAGSTAKMAELTAQQIQELREVRQQLITGEADDMPQDEQQLRLMLNEIDGQCQQLTTLFTGTVQRDTIWHLLTMCPQREMERQVIFRLSKRLGLVDADDLSGVPVYATLTKQDRVENPILDDKKHQGFYVNVPAMTRLVIEQEEEPLATFTLPIAQFGFVELRDGGLFKQRDTHMQLQPATGAVATMTTDAP